MSARLYYKIYELKGLISSLSDIAEREQDMDHPILSRIEDQMTEIIQVIEEGEK